MRIKALDGYHQMNAAEIYLYMFLISKIEDLEIFYLEMK